MSFKVISFFTLLSVFYSSCGVKSDPSPPPGTALPSIPDQYLYVSPEMKKQKAKLEEDEEKEELKDEN